MRDVIGAEWLKLRTVRATYLALGLVLVVVAGVSLLALQVNAMWDHTTPDQRNHFAVSPLADVTAEFVQLCLGVLGVLAVTSEYRTGTIRASLLAVPARWPVLAGKAVVVGALALAAGTGALFATSGLTRLIIGGRPVPGQRSWHTELPLLVTGGLVLAVFALLGLGLGAATRSAVAAISVLVVLWYIGPLVAFHLPGAAGRWLSSVLPGALPGELAGRGNDHSVFGSALPPVAAGLVLAGYALVPLGVATVLLRRRDGG